MIPGMALAGSDAPMSRARTALLRSDAPALRSRAALAGSGTAEWKSRAALARSVAPVLGADTPPSRGALLRSDASLMIPGMALAGSDAPMSRARTVLLRSDAPVAKESPLPRSEALVLRAAMAGLGLGTVLVSLCAGSMRPSGVAEGAGAVLVRLAAAPVSGPGALRSGALLSEPLRALLRSWCAVTLGLRVELVLPPAVLVLLRDVALMGTIGGSHSETERDKSKSYAAK